MGIGQSWRRGDGGETGTALSEGDRALCPPFKAVKVLYRCRS
jgi:hypothetical protein